MQGSVHRAPWPDSETLLAVAGSAAIDSDLTDVASDVLREIRRAKSDAKLSIKTEVDTVTVMDSATRLDLMQAIEDDLRAAGQVRRFDLVPSDAFGVVITPSGVPPSLRFTS